MAWFRLNIVYDDYTNNTLVYKYPLKNMGREINEKSTITVKESQIALFVHKGQIADVLGPGLYTMKTGIFPVMSKLLNWKYGFETPITCDIYYVNTKQFTNIRWGTKNPILMRDSEFGMVRVRGFGSFSFKVDDPTIFLKELFGTNSSFTTANIEEQLKSMLLSTLTDAIGESKISAVDLAGNTEEFNELVKTKVQDNFNNIGLRLVELFIENMSVPEEVEKAIDERSRLGILGGVTDTLLKVSAAEAMKDAAKNEGAGGAFVGAGMGAGMGMGMGQMFGQAFNQPQYPNQGYNGQPQYQNQGYNGQPQYPNQGYNGGQPQYQNQGYNGQPQYQNQGYNGGQPQQNANMQQCPKCNMQVRQGAKFCGNCGEPMQVKKVCPECGQEVRPTAKFCGNCGTKID